MSSFDFDKVVDRRNTGSLKWDVKDGELPMWVADMDFETAPAVYDAIRKRADHPIYGYTDIPDRWYDSICGWWQRRYGFEIRKEWLTFTTGVIPAVSSAVRKLTSPAEKIVVQTPVYNIFFNSIYNNGRYILENRLIYENGTYRPDFEDLEEKLSDPQTTMMILCNPHNPAGKIWSREILEKTGSLCKKYGVIVLSDEIHCDLTAPGEKYIPFASVNDECRDNCVACIAPTKTFNIAGIHTAAVYAPSPGLRNRIRRAVNTDEVAEPNVFAVEAAVAAYENGDEWLDGLREYLFENRKYAEVYIKENIPEIKPAESDATYLMWLDISSVGDSTSVSEFIRSETGLYLTDGAVYRGNGNGFLRMNIACPRTTLIDGLERLRNGIEAYKKESRKLV